MSSPIPSPDPNAFLMGGGIPSVKFAGAGASVTGVVEDQTVTQQTDFKTGKPLTWDDGSPRNQLVVTLQTDEQNHENDTGLRKLYVKGRSLTNAVRMAVREAQRDGFERGGVLTVTYTKDGTRESASINPPKLYTAEYIPPAATSANRFVNDDQPPC